MLLQFSVTNHRSIKDTAIISLKASTDKSLSDCLISPDEKKQLVPVLALYGANAAGKSNVLHALLLMREMVCGRYAKLLKGEFLPQEPFAFTDQPTQPTSFEAIYFYGGIKYAYGFSFDKSKVLTDISITGPTAGRLWFFQRRQWLSVPRECSGTAYPCRTHRRKPALPVQLERVELPSD